MARFASGLAVLALTCIAASPALGSDACGTRAIETRASVAASDGSAFTTRSWFKARDVAAIAHPDNDQIVAVEGPLGWVSRGDRARLGDAFRGFALGHQYHALLRHFDEIAGEVQAVSGIEVGSTTYSGRRGTMPTGGHVTLLGGAPHPAGLLFELPDNAPMQVTFDDWRKIGDIVLPYLVRIDDGTRVFDYRYTHIALDARDPEWFFDAVPAPDLDALRIHRLHRRMLAAHCRGDAGTLAALSAPQVVVAGRGQVHETTPQAMRERFTGLFERLDYREYHDLIPPHIAVAESGDLGWMAVNVRAVGAARDGGQAFDDTWAWIMTLVKRDGVWLHSGNASNRMP